MDDVATSGEVSRGGLTSGVSVESWLPWVVWSMVLVAVAASTAGLFTEAPLEVVRVVGQGLGILAVATIGALVVARGQATTQGWMLLGFSLFFSIGVYAYHLLGVIADDDRVNISAARFTIAIGDSAYVVAFFGLILLFVLMPDGRVPGPGWRAIPWAIGTIASFWVVQSIWLTRTVVDLDAWLERTTLSSLDGAEPEALCRRSRRSAPESAQL